MKAALLCPLLLHLIISHIPHSTLAEEPVATFSIQVTSGDGEPSDVPVTLMIDEDPTAAAFRFVTGQEGLDANHVPQVKKVLIDQLTNANNPHTGPAELSLPTPAEHVQRAEASQQSAAFLQAGADFVRAMILEENEEEANGHMQHARRMITAVRALRSTEAAHAAENCTGVLKGLDVLLSLHANETLMTWAIECQLQEGTWARVRSSSMHLLQKAPSRGMWPAGDPRTKAVLVGANASLEMGDLDQAMKLYSVALRADPDCSAVQGPYKQLKKFSKSLKKVETLLGKSKNHDALALLTELHEQLEQLGLSSSMMRAQLLLQQCLGKAAIRRHEEAIQVCDEAFSLTQQPVEGVHINPITTAKALKARAGAHEADNNWDEAVRDWRKVIEVMQNSVDKEELGELNQKLRNAQHQDTMWEERRDHTQVLKLPENIRGINKVSRCKWLKTQHKAMVLKWHPDKAVGDIKRAARKFDEVALAQKTLKKEWGC